MRPPIIIKKYANRRLYATDESRYVTLEELADKVRRGRDVQVLDASSGADLTQATLTQVILESRGAGKLLPIPLLLQLIRMGDDALAEFFGRYLSAALELYLAARESTRGVFYPFARLPLSPSNPLARLFTGLYGPVGHQAPANPPPGWEKKWQEQIDEERRQAVPEPPPELNSRPESVNDDPGEPTPTETMDMLSSLERQLASLRRSITSKVKAPKKAK